MATAKPGALSITSRAGAPPPRGPRSADIWRRSRSLSLHESRSARLPNTMKAPGTKVSAALGGSPGKGRRQAAPAAPASGPPCPCASPRAPLAPPQLPSSPAAAALLSPPSARRTPSAPALPRPGPSAPPARRLTGTRPRRVGGAAGPRRWQDPLARTKECGEGARTRAGRRAAPAQAPPRALPGPDPGPPRAAPTSRPPASFPPGPAGGRGAPLEIAIGRWRYAFPARPGAPCPSSKVGRGLTRGGLEQY